MNLQLQKPAWFIYARDEARSKVDACLKKAPNQRFRLAVSMTYENAIKLGYYGSMSDWAYLLTRAKLD